MKHWCKLQTKALNDHRLLKLPTDAQLTYYKLMHVAAQCDAFGALVDDDGNALDYDALGIYLRQDPKACEMNIAALMRTGLVTLNETGAFVVTDYSSERDETAAERKREQRLRDKAVTNDSNSNGHGDVTAMSRQSHENVTPLEKEEEKDIEKEKEVFAQSANPPPSKSKSHSEPKEPTAKKSEAELRRGMFFAKVADICKIPNDSKPHARAINAAAVWFTSKAIEPSRLDDFSVWWFANDWRGLKGEYPKPDQIVSEGPKFELGVTAKKQSQPFAATFAPRPTKGEMQMNNIRAGIDAFLAGGD